MELAQTNLYCGTSGFAYPTWKPGFYPDKTPAKKFLWHYAQRLNAVEINFTFRRLPSTAALESWAADTPPHFRFALKAHQRISHIDRLAVTEFVDVFFERIDPLRISGRLGPILVQLPPAVPVDAERLRVFLERAPQDVRLAFEFRNKSWFDERVYALLEQHRAALCLAESEKLATPPVITTDFVYFRLRKVDYSAEERQEIASKVEDLRAAGKDVYVFFKHEETPDGALYAEEMLKKPAAAAEPSA